MAHVHEGRGQLLDDPLVLDALALGAVDDDKIRLARRLDLAVGELFTLALSPAHWPRRKLVADLVGGWILGLPRFRPRAWSTRPSWPP